MLETVVLGTLCQGMLGLWQGSGAHEVVEVGDVDLVDGLLGVGRLARTSPEPQRYREVAMLEPGAGTLLLMDRPRPGDLGTAHGAAKAVTVRRITTPDADDDAWSEVGRRWTDALRHAAGRGELIVVEPGGWEGGSERYALGAVMPGDDGGGWVSHVEASPAPAGGVWGATGEGTTRRAPVTPGAIDVAGVFLADAVRAWAPSPWSLAVTYVTAPWGAFTAGGSA